MSQKSKTEGVRTSLVLSEHASTVASGAQFKKKRKEEEEKRAKEKGKSLNKNSLE